MIWLRKILLAWCNATWGYTNGGLIVVDDITEILADCFKVCYWVKRRSEAKYGKVLLASQQYYGALSSIFLYARGHTYIVHPNNYWQGRYSVLER